MYSAHAANLRRAIFIHSCQRERPGKLHLFEASLSIHYESLPSDCLLSVRSAASSATGRSSLGISRAASRCRRGVGRAASGAAGRSGLGIGGAASRRGIGGTARSEGGNVLEILGHDNSFRLGAAGRSRPDVDAFAPKHIMRGMHPTQKKALIY